MQQAEIFQQSANRAKAEIAKRNAVLTMLRLFLMVFRSIALGIPAIIIYQLYGQDDCIGTYDAISFNYATWLLIYGLFNLAYFAFATMIELANFIYETNHETLGFIVALASLFHVAWYVVGSVLFWIEIAPWCGFQHPLYQFGLAVFILDMIASIGVLSTCKITCHCKC